MWQVWKVFENIILMHADKWIAYITRALDGTMDYIIHEVYATGGGNKTLTNTCECTSRISSYAHCSILTITFIKCSIIIINTVSKSTNIRTCCTLIDICKKRTGFAECPEMYSFNTLCTIL